MKKIMKAGCYLCIASLGVLVAGCSEKNEEASLNPPETQTASAVPAPSEQQKSGAFDLNQLINKANSGDIQAQLRIADHYDMSGQYKQAVQWLQKAANLNNAAAQRMLADYYDQGRGVNQDYQLAFTLYGKAAAQNDAAAILAMSNYYNSGLAVEQDTQKADQLFRQALDLIQKQAVEKQDPQAETALGELLVNIGGTQSIHKGILWLEKAAQSGDSRALLSLGQAYLLEDAGNNLPDLDKSIKVLEQSAQKGNAEATMLLGSIYLKQGETKENMDKVIAAYTKIAEKGSVDAQLALASLYLDGADDNLVAVDKAKGIEWLTKAAEQGDSEAIQSLIDIYENGEGVPKNLEEALKWTKVQMENTASEIAQKEKNAPQEKSAEQ